MPKTEILTLRVSAEFKKRVAEEAAREHRSITNYIEATLARMWEANNKKSSSAKEKH
jgi:predicted HicB family RNase H-like nuclease